MRFQTSSLGFFFFFCTWLIGYVLDIEVNKIKIFLFSWLPIKTHQIWWFGLSFPFKIWWIASNVFMKNIYMGQNHFFYPLFRLKFGKKLLVKEILMCVIVISLVILQVLKVISSSKTKGLQWGGGQIWEQ